MNTDIYAQAVRDAARHVAPVLRRLGYELDDCEQEGWVGVVEASKKATISEFDPKLAYVIARRAILKAARKEKKEYDPVEQTYLESVEDRTKSYAVTAELQDVIESAPHDVALYLSFRVLDGLTWEETATTLGVSNDRLARTRTAAADWLLAQLEGRKHVS